MGEKSLWKKLSLKVQVETKIVIAVVTVVVIEALIGTMAVDVEVEMESDLSVASLGILQGSVLVKGAEEVGMGGGMTGIVVLEENQEMTAIIGTVLVSMKVMVQETSVWGRKNTPNSKQLEVLLLLTGGVKVSFVASLLHGSPGG
ncbi:hypothetical protein NL676_039393 [Syzygium grande]|nr:hypothetical protein NL676_039393 [Syzygium grande]